MSSKTSTTRNRILTTTWQLMEKNHGLGIRMSDIAKEVGISRQALYLHFKSRTDLVIATVLFVDDVKGVGERLEKAQTADSGVQLLENIVEFWGNYIPDIYGIARALLMTRETDTASALAWDDRMKAVRGVCERVIRALERDEALSKEWTRKEATDMLSTMLSIQNWEQLTVTCGWSTRLYIRRMKKLTRLTFIRATGSGD